MQLPQYTHAESGSGQNVMSILGSPASLPRTLVIHHSQDSCRVTLPAGVASVPYVAPDNNVLAMGTIGSNRQQVLPVPGMRPGMPAGDLVASIVAEAEATLAKLRP